MVGDTAGVLIAMAGVLVELMLNIVVHKATCMYAMYLHLQEPYIADSS